MALRAGLRREAALYFSAQLFLTRLPAPRWIGHEPDRLARACRWFPLVGLLIGGLTGLVWLGASHLVPSAAAAALAIGAGLLLTGALHEDGFADCCDGLGGGFTRERALEIMRDSRIGVYGAAGLILTFLLRWSALESFAPLNGVAALIIAAVTGRAAMVIIMARSPYARPDGAAREVSAGIAAFTVLQTLALLAVFTALAGGPSGIIAAGAALALIWLWSLYLDHRLGGYTGDGLGAGCVIAECTALLILAGMWT